MSKSVPDVASVAAAVEASKDVLSDSDKTFLVSYLKRADVAQALETYQLCRTKTKPNSTNATGLCAEVCGALDRIKSDDATQLAKLLRSMRMQAGLSIHDALATGNFPSKATPSGEGAAAPSEKKKEDAAPVAAAVTAVAATTAAAVATTAAVTESKSEAESAKKAAEATSAAATTTATPTTTTPTTTTPTTTEPAKEAAAAASAAAPAAAAATAASTSAPAASDGKSAVSVAVPSDGVVVREVNKAGKPLGATITQRDGKIYVARVITGGAAFKSQALHAEDQILAINGIDLSRKSAEEVVNILKTAEGTIKFKLKLSTAAIAALKTPGKPVIKKRYVMPMFMYNPGRDEFCPCPQAGLAFKRRQVLKIIDDSDTDWWQAQLDTTRLVGLVPSPRMQERRPAARAAALSAQQQKIEHDAAKKRKSLIKRLTSRKSSKRSATQMAAAQIEAEVLKKSPATEDPYVEVRKEKPQAGQKRPLVLVGASQISGRNELKQKLVSDYPSRFGVTVPHTTRPMRSGEVDGRDYIFTTRDTMEKLVNEGRFVEHGEFQGNLYGTSIDTIKAVVESGRVCLLDVHPHTLKNLRYYKPTPLVVFIKPPSLEKLKQTRGDANLSDEQLERMVENSNKIDTNYGHFFDFSLSFDTLESTYEQLKALLDKSESEDYWAPVVRSNTTKPTSSTA